MITTASKGNYQIYGYKKNTKILYLNEQAYSWVNPKYIGEILIYSHERKKYDIQQCSGKYNLYDVSDEEYLTNMQHMEISYGHGAWQGYLLPKGLPKNKNDTKLIIPTLELITSMPFYMTNLRFMYSN